MQEFLYLKIWKLWYRSTRLEIITKSGEHTTAEVEKHAEWDREDASPDPQGISTWGRKAPSRLLELQMLSSCRWLCLEKLTTLEEWPMNIKTFLAKCPQRPFPGTLGEGKGFMIGWFVGSAIWSEKDVSLWPLPYSVDKTADIKDNLGVNM